MRIAMAFWIHPISTFSSKAMIKRFLFRFNRATPIHRQVSCIIYYGDSSPLLKMLNRQKILPAKVMLLEHLREYSN
ncbi:unnamed protein product [Toxocara canis]|uniref:Glycosyl transferase n=1 Tax=Toxocara canis TaxID=6265 RepID=A0A183TVV3_TOXCA|nr:unnamed protein product [Toxocara canis]